MNLQTINIYEVEKTDEQVTYLSEIISALTDLGGSASLKEINDYIEFRNSLSSIKTNKNWKRNVSAVIQRHCSETKSYLGAKNIFYSVFGLGEGFWGLISMKANEDIGITPIEQRLEKEILDNKNIDSTEKEMIIKARKGQGVFRDKIIEKYQKCIIKGICDKRLLFASHVKPWRTSSNSDRLSSENGLLLSPLFDKLFDTGLLTFNKNMNIILSDKLTIEDRAKIYYDKHLRFIQNPSIELKQNMEYHRDVIFKT